MNDGGEKMSIEYVVGRGSFGYAILAKAADKSEYVLKLDKDKMYLKWEACMYEIVSNHHNCCYHMLLYLMTEELSC